MSTRARTRTKPLIPTGTWKVDRAHSSVRFSVKHMGIANVRGTFGEFDVKLEMRESLADCRAFAP
jgi:polyisoprenoid-binding protein YceI